MTAEEVHLLAEATPDKPVRIVVFGCAYACCGRGWQRRDGYEQTYHGYVQQLEQIDPDCNCHIPMLEGAGQHAPGCAVFKLAGTFMLYSAGIGTLNYVIACRFSEVELVERIGQLAL